MFLRNHGPESINYIEKDLEEAVESESKEEIKAELAYKTLCQKVLSHYKNGWEVDYTGMDETEKALAFLLECFYSYLNRTELFIQDFENWEWKLKLKPELSFVEAIKAIDEHMGSSDWREICYLQEHQDRMMERAFEVEEERRVAYLKYKAEHPEDGD